MVSVKFCKVRAEHRRTQQREGQEHLNEQPKLRSDRQGGEAGTEVSRCPGHEECYSRPEVGHKYDEWQRSTGKENTIVVLACVLCVVKCCESREPCQ